MKHLHQTTVKSPFNGSNVSLLLVITAGYYCWLSLLVIIKLKETRDLICLPGQKEASQPLPVVCSKSLGKCKL